VVGPGAVHEAQPAPRITPDNHIFGQATASNSDADFGTLGKADHRLIHAPFQRLNDLEFTLLGDFQPMHCINFSHGDRLC
jgi:hypothetical protein